MLQWLPLSLPSTRTISFLLGQSWTLLSQVLVLNFLQNIWISMHRLPEAVPDHTNSYTDTISRTWQETEEGPPFD